MSKPKLLSNMQQIILSIISLGLLIVGTVLFVYGVRAQMTDALLLGFFLGMVGVVLTVALSMALEKQHRR